MTDMKKTDDLVDDANQSKLESKPVHEKCHRRGSGNICQYLLLVREGVRLARVAAAGHRRHQSHRKKGKNQKKMCLVNQE